MNGSELYLLENRPERAYDEQAPSVLILPNGTRGLFMDRRLGNVLARHVIDLHINEGEGK